MNDIYHVTVRWFGLVFLGCLCIQVGMMNSPSTESEEVLYSTKCSVNYGLSLSFTSDPITGTVPYNISNSSLFYNTTETHSFVLCFSKTQPIFSRKHRFYTLTSPSVKVPLLLLKHTCVLKEKQVLAVQTASRRAEHRCKNEVCGMLTEPQQCQELRANLV